MGKRLLLIDDSTLVAQLVSAALEQLGLHCDVVADLSGLDEKLAAHRYDLVVVDVNMPEMYGDDVVEYLRTSKGVKAKFVLFSDLPEAQLAEKARVSGADGYISKSIGLEQAASRLAQFAGA